MKNFLKKGNEVKSPTLTDLDNQEDRPMSSYDRDDRVVPPQHHHYIPHNQYHQQQHPHQNPHNDKRHSSHNKSLDQNVYISREIVKDTQGHLGSSHFAHHKNLQNQPHRGPQDYLFWSIANIFIFVILALPALFFSVQTRDMKRAGNIERAKYYSKRSLILNIVASVLGLVAITLAILFRFALYHLFVQNDVQSQNVPLTFG